MLKLGLGVVAVGAGLAAVILSISFLLTSLKDDVVKFIPGSGSPAPTVSSTPTDEETVGPEPPKRTPAKKKARQQNA